MAIHNGMVKRKPSIVACFETNFLVRHCGDESRSDGGRDFLPVTLTSLTEEEIVGFPGSFGPELFLEYMKRRWKSCALGGVHSGHSSCEYSSGCVSPSKMGSPIEEIRISQHHSRRVQMWHDDLVESRACSRKGSKTLIMSCSLHKCHQPVEDLDGKSADRGHCGDDGDA